ncbi:hypothetical protein J6590_002274, partial [Homalodisca vitripennis]
WDGSVIDLAAHAQDTSLIQHIDVLLSDLIDKGYLSAPSPPPIECLHGTRCVWCWAT